MADEPIPETEDVPVASPPAPPAESEEVVTLLDYAEVFGEMRPRGKVLRLPASEAQRLVAEQKARPATEFDRRIAGID